jgi:hypothetical protein
MYYLRSNFFRGYYCASYYLAGSAGVVATFGASHVVDAGVQTKRSALG